jgi:hypothetical protein
MVVTASIVNGLLTVVSDVALTDVRLSVVPLRYPSVPYYRSAPYQSRTIALGYADGGAMLRWLYVGGGYRDSRNPSYSASPAMPTPSDLRNWVLDPLVESSLAAYAPGFRADFNSAALRLVYSGTPQTGLVSPA